jgi:ABC-type polysaccharide/polyol phosphate export permease
VIPDLIRSRELLVDLIIKDLRVRYRYALIGFLWALIEPLALTVILTVVFTVFFDSRVEGAGAVGGIPYPVTLLSGLILWQFFSQSLSRATRSLLDNRQLVQKVHFAREVLPLSSIGFCLVNLVIGLAILVCLHCAFGGSPATTWLWAPVILLVEFCLVVGAALLLSSLNVRFHDISHMVDVGLIFGFYATPIFYFIEHVQSRLANPWYLRLYLANPMAGLVSAFRQALLYGETPDATYLAWPALLAMALLAVGAIVFRRNAGYLADYV